MMYMNHELFSASFHYALEYENSFQIYCFNLSNLAQGSTLCKFVEL